MGSAKDRERRVFVVRASVYVPAEGLHVEEAPGVKYQRLTGSDAIASQLRTWLRAWLDEGQFQVRTAQVVEITSGLHVRGIDEPTAAADVETHVVPDPAALADLKRRIANAEPLTADDGLLLLAEVERWRVRFAARFETPEGQALFRRAADELIGGAMTFRRMP